MSPPHRQSVAWISEELGMYFASLYNRRKGWRFQGESVPGGEKAEGWGAIDKFTVVLKTAGLNSQISA